MHVALLSSNHTRLRCANLAPAREVENPHSSEHITSMADDASTAPFFGFMGAASALVFSCEWPLYSWIMSDSMSSPRCAGQRDPAERGLRWSHVLLTVKHGWWQAIRGRIRVASLLAISRGACCSPGRLCAPAPCMWIDDSACGPRRPQSAPGVHARLRPGLYRPWARAHSASSDLAMLVCSGHAPSRPWEPRA